MDGNIFYKVIMVFPILAEGCWLRLILCRWLYVTVAMLGSVTTMDEINKLQSEIYSTMKPLSHIFNVSVWEK